MASDYGDTLIAVQATNADTKYSLNVTRVDHPLNFDEHAVSYNSTDFLWFQIDVSESFLNEE